MMGQKKFNMKHHHQLCLDDLVSSGHLYRKIEQTINFNFIYDLTKPYYSHTGQPSLDPVVFFKIELVSFLEGVHEDRALGRRIRDSLAIRWFLGYDLDEALPVHSTISRTRKDRMVSELYEAVFRSILSLCIRHQLVKGSHQSMDSTLLKANASLHSLDILQTKVREHYQKTTGSPLPQSAKEQSQPPKKRWTFFKPFRRDPEAKVTQKPGAPAAPYYKASASVDEAYGIITQAQMDDANKNDCSLLMPFVTRLKQGLHSLGLCLKSLATDQGFYAAANLAFLDQEKLIGYIPPRLQRDCGKILHQDLFRYVAEKDQFICPAGNILKAQPPDRYLPHLKRYRARQQDCCRCPQKIFCTHSQARTLRISSHEPLIQTALERCKSPLGQQRIKQRRAQAEGAFANIKEALNFKKCHALGLNNANKKLLIACAVLNLKKLIRALEASANTFYAFWAKLLAYFKEQKTIKYALAFA